jgi:hypothetical protein
VNKYVLFMTFILVLALLTFIAISIDEAAASNIFLENLPTNPTRPGLLTILSTVWRYLTIFFRILTFEISGIPVIINILLFYPIRIAVVYMLIDIIRGNG